MMGPLKLRPEPNTTQTANCHYTLCNIGPNRIDFGQSRFGAISVPLSEHLDSLLEVKVKSKRANRQTNKQTNYRGLTHIKRMAACFSGHGAQ